MQTYFAVMLDLLFTFFLLLLILRYILSPALLTIFQSEITNVDTCENSEVLVYLNNIETLSFWVTKTEKHRDPSLQEQINNYD